MMNRIDMKPRNVEAHSSGFDLLMFSYTGLGKLMDQFLDYHDIVVVVVVSYLERNTSQQCRRESLGLERFPRLRMLNMARSWLPCSLSWPCK